MKIERFCYGPEGTFSQATLGGVEFFFCEPPWKDNQPFESCIPEGKYKVRPDMTGEYRGFELQNVKGRTEIEVHTGNHVGHTDGCLLVGSSLTGYAGHWAVANSKAAMREFKELMMRENVKEVEITSIFSEKKSKKKAAAKGEE